MRDLKFRAWDKGINEFISWKELLTDGYFEVLETGLKGDSDIILQQFTGLHDKNGKEIYEGDILETAEGKYKVYWWNDHSRWAIGNHKTSMHALYFINKHAEISGNIYENPNLVAPTK